MARTVTIDYTILSAVPSGSGVVISFTLACPEVALTQTYQQYFETILLDQGVTTAMSAEERATQVNGTFKTLTRTTFETFAARAKALVGQSEVITGLSGGVASLSISPLIGQQWSVEL